MEDKDKPKENARRGRKPIGERPMTAAERKRNSRMKKEAGGWAEFLLHVGPGHLKFIDKLAKAGGKSRSRILQELLDMGIHRMAVAVAEASIKYEAGVPDEEVEKQQYDYLLTAPSIEAIEKYKELLGINE